MTATFLQSPKDIRLLSFELTALEVMLLLLICKCCYIISYSWNWFIIRPWTSGKSLSMPALMEHIFINFCCFMKDKNMKRKTKYCGWWSLAITPWSFSIFRMWREIRLLSESKPVIASMSDVAASGGYYMAMAAGTILAENLTLTGSIGVVTGELNNFYATETW